VDDLNAALMLQKFNYMPSNEEKTLALKIVYDPRTMGIAKRFRDCSDVKNLIYHEPLSNRRFGVFNDTTATK
jgi:hypothetical protein